MSDENLNSSERGSCMQGFAEFFDSQKWQYTPLLDRPAIQLDFTGENARWQCVAIADPKHAHLVFLSLLPCRVPANRRTAVADLFARINWGLTHGCFELNADTGEARLRTSRPLPSAEIHPDFIAALVFANTWAMDHFFGTVMQVVYAGVAPKAALAPATAGLQVQPRLELN